MGSDAPTCHQLDDQSKLGWPADASDATPCLAKWLKVWEGGTAEFPNHNNRHQQQASNWVGLPNDNRSLAETTHGTQQAIEFVLVSKAAEDVPFVTSL